MLTTLNLKVGSILHDMELNIVVLRQEKGLIK